MTDDRDHPPPRDGLTDAQVWEWADDEHWQVREIAAFEHPNLGGSVDPVDPGRGEDR